MKTERLIRKRIEMGYTVPELARKVGVAKSTMYRYESGAIEKMPSHRLVEIARILETSAEYLLYWDDETEDHIEHFTLPRPLSQEEHQEAKDFILTLIQQKP